jgi:hypothetical protein
LHGERIIPLPWVISIFGSLKKNIQKKEKIFITAPSAIQIVFAGNPVNTEINKKTNPAAKEGIINGKPSFRIDIVPCLGL